MPAYVFVLEKPPQKPRARKPKPAPERAPSSSSGSDRWEKLVYIEDVLFTVCKTETSWFKLFVGFAVTVSLTKSVTGRNETSSGGGSWKSAERKRRQRSFAGCGRGRKRRRRKRRRKKRTKDGKKMTAVATAAVQTKA